MSHSYKKWGLAQMDRHWDQNKIRFKSHWRQTFFAQIYPSLRSNTKLTTLPTLCITGKLDSTIALKARSQQSRFNEP